MIIGESVFYEKINVKKLKYIINNRSKYEAIITEQEKVGEELTRIIILMLCSKKIKENVFIPNDLRDSDYGYLKITYKKGAKSNDIGRWYCNKGIRIQPLCVSVRHTICDDLQKQFFLYSGKSDLSEQQLLDVEALMSF